MLYTKSIQVKPNKKDGLRICIMRRPPKEALYDIWMPHLAPSEELLDAYYDKKITWEKYEKRFIPEVLDKAKIYLEILLDIAKNHVVTILCWEKTPEKCHRRLTAERLQQMDSQLKVILK